MIGFVYRGFGVRSLCSMPLRGIFNSTRECPFPTDVLAVVVEVQVSHAMPALLSDTVADLQVILFLPSASSPSGSASMQCIATKF